MPAGGIATPLRLNLSISATTTGTDECVSHCAHASANHEEKK
jgi:hypothetical protein